MTTKNLTRHYPNGYTLAQTYSGVSVTGSAVLGGSTANHGVNGVVALNAQYALSVANAGVVVGGSGGEAGQFQQPGGTFKFYRFAGAGGVGLAVGGYTAVTNTGAISGGAGGGVTDAYDGGVAGKGGIAIQGAGGQDSMASSVVNWSSILGGAGGPGSSAEGDYYAAGSGAVGGGGISGVSTVTNHGVIQGGRGGAGGVGFSAYGFREKGPLLFGGDGGAGATGVDVGAGYIDNSGSIAGGVGGAGGDCQYGGGGSGGGGGAADRLTSGTILNSGTLSGGQGGAGGTGCKGFRFDPPRKSGAGGAGSAGAYVQAGYFDNSGVVMGGVGGAGGYSPTTLGGAGGLGGAGIHLGSGTVVNSGTIIGADGGDGGAGRGKGGAGGAGVYLASGLIVNTGLIEGSQGGAYGDFDGKSTGRYAPDGAAIEMFSGTLINSGTIEGAVELGNEDRVISEAGAVVVGTVSASNGVLETTDGAVVVSGLAGAAGTLSGAMSMTFTGFVVDQIDQASTWTLAGINAIASGQTVVDDGVIVNHGNLDLSGAIGGSGSLVISQGQNIIEAGAQVTVATFLVRAPSLTIAGDLAYAGDFSEAPRSVLTVKSGAALAFGGETTLTGTVAGLGTLTMEAGASTLAAGAALLVADWSLDGGTTTVAESLVYQGAFSMTGATLTVAAGDQLTLARTSTFFGLVDGAGRLKVSTAMVDGLTVGGSVTLEVAKSATQTGAVMIGDETSGAATLTIDQGATWTMADGGIARGQSADSIIDVHGTLIHSAPGIGVVSVGMDDTGAVVAAAGTLDLAGALAGTGTLIAEGGATLEVDDTAAKTLSVSLDGPGAVLALKAPTSFAATIAGFAAGDRIHLLGLLAHGAVLGAGDILEIRQGNSIVATLQLAGDYVGDTFTARPDGHGGTNITVSGSGGASPPDPPPRGPLIPPLVQAMAAFGARPGVGTLAHGAAGHGEAALLIAPRGMAA